MNLCSEKHDEICYEGCRCPVCDMREDLEGTIDDLERQITNLTEELNQS